MTAEPMQLACPVFFVGFMGAGKTSVARRLARTCGISSVDMDTYLERREGKRVKEIFAEAARMLSAPSRPMSCASFPRRRSRSSSRAGAVSSCARKTARFLPNRGSSCTFR